MEGRENLYSESDLLGVLDRIGRKGVELIDFLVCYGDMQDKTDDITLETVAENDNFEATMLIMEALSELIYNT